MSNKKETKPNLNPKTRFKKEAQAETTQAVGLTRARARAHTHTHTHTHTRRTTARRCLCPVFENFGGGGNGKNGEWRRCCIWDGGVQGASKKHNTTYIVRKLCWHQQTGRPTRESAGIRSGLGVAPLRQASGRGTNLGRFWPFRCSTAPGTLLTGCKSLGLGHAAQAVHTAAAAARTEARQATARWLPSWGGGRHLQRLPRSRARPPALRIHLPRLLSSPAPPGITPRARQHLQRPTAVLPIPFFLLPFFFGWFNLFVNQEMEYWMLFSLQR